MSYCGKNSLYSILKQQKRLSKAVAVKVVQQLLRVVCYLHSKGVCHRDIKLENVLVHQNSIRVIDFGFSCFSEKALTTHCGTPSYMAPEIINKEKYDGKASDIWAVGVLFACLVQGSFPFRAANEKELFRKIRKCDFQLEVGDLGIRRVLVGMLSMNPESRASAEEVVECVMYWVAAGGRAVQVSDGRIDGFEMYLVSLFARPNILYYKMINDDFLGLQSKEQIEAK